MNRVLIEKTNESDNERIIVKGSRNLFIENRDGERSSLSSFYLSFFLMGFGIGVVFTLITKMI